MKLEIEHLQHLLEQGRLRMTRDFEAWFVEVHMAPAEQSGNQFENNLEPSPRFSEFKSQSPPRIEALIAKGSRAAWTPPIQNNDSIIRQETFVNDERSGNVKDSSEVYTVPSDFTAQHRQNIDSEESIYAGNQRDIRSAEHSRNPLLSKHGGLAISADHISTPERNSRDRPSSSSSNYSRKQQAHFKPTISSQTLIGSAPERPYSRSTHHSDITLTKPYESSHRITHGFQQPDTKDYSIPTLKERPPSQSSFHSTSHTTRPRPSSAIPSSTKNSINDDIQAFYQARQDIMKRHG